MFDSVRRTYPVALALALAAGVAACSDNPVEPEEEHAEPASVVIRLGNQDLATATVTESTGTLTVPVGTETDHLSVVFLAEDGGEIEADAEDYLEVEVEDDTVAEFEQDEPGEFGGHLHGHEVAATRLRLSFMHGTVGSGHSHFTSAWIDVEVTQ